MSAQPRHLIRMILVGIILLPLMAFTLEDEGFVTLFNGENLDGWIGNKDGYKVKKGVIEVFPESHGGGNLLTKKEYSNFVFRFEFQLTPGANNGLGYHANPKGDVAYKGKELQIIDNTHPKYKDLKDYQYHGSLYGVAPAKRGALKPVGDWNQQEVRVVGNTVKVELNGTLILDIDYSEAIRNGTKDGKDHPGLKKTRGHIGFLGHGDVVRFRNITIKELPN